MKPEAKTKHTQGRLIVEDRVERLVIWADGAHQEIASLPTVAEGADDAAQVAYEEEQHANAALFAAAPEMLEALRGALDSLEYVAYAAPGLVGCGVREQRITEVRAAIAKAEGKS